MNTGEQVYLSTLSRGQTSLNLVDSEYHHLIRVRRFSVGQEIWVVNGQGLAAHTKITNIGSDSLNLEISSFEDLRGELPTELILAIANLKGDHLGMVIEKSTELGVNQIFPLFTDHTVKKGLNLNRLERIALSAMKQSRRSKVPTVHELTTCQDLMHAHQDATHLFCYGTDSVTPLMENRDQIQGSNRVVIWIGPEGDWSKDEIDLASISDYTFTGLGPRRLRAETAAIHAVGLVSALLQDPV